MENTMSVNNILLVFGSLFIGSTAWLMITVSELSGDVKVIKYQVSANSEDLKELKKLKKALLNRK
tara:strand:- start:2373 stop:2567 length:195 start_codon:yes stop_codon:yes gene_type:complete